MNMSERLLIIYPSEEYKGGLIRIGILADYDRSVKAREEHDRKAREVRKKFDEEGLLIKNRIEQFEILYGRKDYVERQSK